MSDADGRRLTRLAEELRDLTALPSDIIDVDGVLIEEIDHVLRPAVHERRILSTGAIVDPQSESAEWSAGAQLDIVRTPVAQERIPTTRRFADGLSSWLLRRTSHDDEWVIFDRPASSERDLVVLSDVFQATIVQRHPSGSVRVVGPFGVLRWDRMRWHYEPPISAWIDTLMACDHTGDATVLNALLAFAVHDLGSQGIGTLLIYRPRDEPGPAVDDPLPAPPPLRIRTPFHLAPLRHALAQVDGAAVFNREGTLQRLGVRLIPSSSSIESIESFGGTRHTSGRRYSFDDPSATVIAVSDDGPVTVLRNGRILGRSTTASERPNR
jgi:hypothetical protein